MAKKEERFEVTFTMKQKLPGSQKSANHPLSNF